MTQTLDKRTAIDAGDLVDLAQCVKRILVYTCGPNEVVLARALNLVEEEFVQFVERLEEVSCRAHCIT